MNYDEGYKLAKSFLVGFVADLEVLSSAEEIEQRRQEVFRWLRSERLSHDIMTRRSLVNHLESLPQWNRYHTRDTIIVAAVDLLVEKGISFTRNEGSLPESACDIVSVVLTEECDVLLSHEGVRKLYYRYHNKDSD